LNVDDLCLNGFLVLYVYDDCVASFFGLLGTIDFGVVCWELRNALYFVHMFLESLMRMRAAPEQLTLCECIWIIVCVCDMKLEILGTQFGFFFHLLFVQVPACCCIGR
jgi:hypothetical protein